MAAVARREPRRRLAAGRPARQTPCHRPQPRWRQSIGGGYSGIAVSSGRVYTLDYRKKPRESERVLCFDVRTGKLLWSHTYPVAYGKMEYGNGPRSTPTVHKGKVYTFGARGHLFCLDAVSGKVLWGRDTVKDFAGRVPQWGHSCSPLVDGGAAAGASRRQNGAGLVALDRDSGKEIWCELDDRPGYSSPTLIGGPGWRQVAYWTPEHVVGLDPVSGKVRWKIPFPITYDVSITDLVWHQGVLLASNYWTGSKAICFDAKGENPKVIGRAGG